MHFGHIHGDRYSVLILDNRGMGRSDKPLMRYSTSAMAADILEVVDHLSWTEERQLHICGISSTCCLSIQYLQTMEKTLTRYQNYSGRQ